MNLFFYFGMLILFVEVGIYVKHYFFNIAFFVIIYKMERGAVSGNFDFFFWMPLLFVRRVQY
ncbi:MAG TPA: hypothetical protein DCZ74_01860, partial [Treponema sp.]|nr:hypothetical protein [Treponema sp.]